MCLLRTALAKEPRPSPDTEGLSLWEADPDLAVTDGGGETERSGDGGDADKSREGPRDVVVDVVVAWVSEHRTVLKI